nr:glycosyltransferase family 4 protein [Desulfobacula sp.]
MNILLIHNSYINQGGEDFVVRIETNLFKAKGLIYKTYCIENIKITDLSSKIRIGLKAPYSKDQKQIIFKKIIELNPNIVHVHNFFPLLTPSVYDACIEAGVPVVQTLHNYRTICPGALLMRDGKICEICVTASPYNGALHTCYRNSFFASFAVARMVAYHRKKLTWQYKVNRFIALTEFGKNKFIEADFPANKIIVKPNFVEDPLKSEKSIHPNRNGKALFVGRLSPEKGVDILNKAWKNIHYPLEIAGTGPLFSELKKNSPDNITFLGQLSKEEVTHKMMESSFLIMPSICYEGFPLVIVEAFACGLPVLASRLGSMEEIIQDGITGMHFKAGDADDLAEKVSAMLASPERLIQMGINARNEYETKYTPEKNYELLMDIYNKVIEEHKTGGYAKPI